MLTHRGISKSTFLGSEQERMWNTSTAEKWQGQTAPKSVEKIRCIHESLVLKPFLCGKTQETLFATSAQPIRTLPRYLDHDVDAHPHKHSNKDVFDWLKVRDG
jgi:hypothetical protein